MLDIPSLGLSGYIDIYPPYLVRLGYSKAKIATAMADLKGDRITEGCIL